MQDVVLAFLAKEPSYGYDLRARLRAALGPFGDEHNDGQIYVTLGRLEKAGLVTVELIGDGAGRDRKVYALTPGGHRRVAAAAGLGWLAGTAELAWARIAPGPRDRDEVRRMLLTSAAIPLAAAWHSARGAWRHRSARPWRGLPELVLFDRDGTLVHDVPYNGDPALVAPVAEARESLDRLRRLGIRVGLVSNQSGVGSGRISVEQVEAVNRRVEAALGPFDTVQWCPHGADEGCSCRKPAPGMVLQALEEIGAQPDRCVLVGDIGTDVRAAEAAGCVGMLVPAPETSPEDVARASIVHADLGSAVSAILGGRW